MLSGAHAPCVAALLVARGDVSSGHLIGGSGAAADFISALLMTERPRTLACKSPRSNCSFAVCLGRIDTMDP
jgi:hypothetical protein